MKIAALIIASLSALLIISLALPSPARATLGEGADTVARDRRALSATRGASTSYPSYTVHESATEGSTIREFLNASGVVFAIAWKGMAPPDLNTLLGSYAGEYRAARAKVPRSYGKKGAKVQGARVVVETWGHMRNLQGRAYLPALMPEGVTVDEIK